MQTGISDLEPGADGKIDASDANEFVCGGRSRAPIGDPGATLVKFPNDGRADSKPANDNILSGKTTRSWVAMERARACTLMNTDLENGYAQVVLRRVRRDIDEMCLDLSALPSPAGSAFANEAQDHDTTVIDLCGEIEWDDDGPGPRRSASIPKGFNLERYVTYGPAPEVLAKTDPKQFTPKLASEKRGRAKTPKGFDRRTKAEKYHDLLFWSCKVHPRNHSPSFDPAHADLRPISRAIAIDNVVALSSLMQRELFVTIIDMACFNITIREIGFRAGFNDKRADAVGLDRARLSISAAVDAYSTIDRIQSSSRDRWWQDIPDASTVPATMFKRMAEAARTVRLAPASPQRNSQKSNRFENVIEMTDELRRAA